MGRRGRSNFTVSAMSYGLRRNAFARSMATSCPFRQLPHLAAPEVRIRCLDSHLWFSKVS